VTAGTHTLSVVRIDLHCHSTASDGTRPPAEVMQRARAAGLDVVALTDHDTLAGHEEARSALPPGLTLVPGLELSCQLASRSVHLLAYLVDPGHPGLAGECEAIRGDRVRRAQAMVARLQALGVPITWEQVTALAQGTVGRPHIARAMVAAGVISRPEQAFTSDWLAPGGRAHVERYAPDPVRAIGLVRDAGGVAVLAHPGLPARGWVIPDDTIATLAANGLAGLEADHPDHDQRERDRLRALAAGLGLAVTGGSDDHGVLTGDRLGCATTAPEAYQRLLAGAAAGPVSGQP
jgi:predicted metal-dependent phosphoesterase TrpH